jgi:hypothetical protein
MCSFFFARSGSKVCIWICIITKKLSTKIREIIARYCNSEGSRKMREKIMQHEREHS